MKDSKTILYDKNSLNINNYYRRLKLNQLKKIDRW